MFSGWFAGLPIMKYCRCQFVFWLWSLPSELCFRMNVGRSFLEVWFEWILAKGFFTWWKREKVLLQLSWCFACFFAISVLQVFVLFVSSCVWNFIVTIHTLLYINLSQPVLYQWLFLVPLKGGRWHIFPQLAVYTTYIYHSYIAFWGVICYLPPFRGTRNNHWL